MGISHVAVAARSDGERGARPARRAEDQTVRSDRGGDHLEQVAFAAPQLLAGHRVVGLHLPLAAHDQLIVVADRDCNRRAPADAGRPFCLPSGLAGLGIKRDDEGAVGHPVVPAS